MPEQQLSPFNSSSELLKNFICSNDVKTILTSHVILSLYYRCNKSFTDSIEKSVHSGNLGYITYSCRPIRICKLVKLNTKRVQYCILSMVEREIS